ncbi:MAG: hypothetical protein K2I33_02045, partial [Oscillospiraceae bacterium]|nr:hypothetical protein [Oscillospiraceae bacterium]
MVSSDLKKLAVEKGMKTAHNICYGNLNGYTVTLSDINTGRALREIYISTVLNEDVKNKINEALNSADAVKQYKIYSVELNDHFICIRFAMAMGLMKRFTPFIDWFMPVVAASGAPESVCPECGNPIQGDEVKKLLGGHAVCMHSACAQALINNVKEEEEEFKNAKSNAGKGLLGSVIFGLVSAIPWAIVYALGWFVGWLGALIGAAIVKGYTMFGGKVKKSVIPVMALLVIVCVFFAQLLGDGLQLAYYISKGELYGEWSDIPEYMSLLFEDSDYIAIFVKNIL